MLCQYLMLVTLHCSLQLVLSKTIRIGDTKSYLVQFISIEFSILNNLFYKSFNILRICF